jgi:hypothetical protein
MDNDGINLNELQAQQQKQEETNVETVASWVTADIFPDPLWRGHYPGDLTELRKKTYDFLKNSDKLNAGLERDGGASSSSDPEMPHMWTEAHEFFQWANEDSLQIWNYWGYKHPEQRQIARSWANYHPKEAWTDEHTHGDTDQVMVLYLDVPKDSGDLEIHNPLFYHWEGSKRMSGTNGWRNLKVKTGDVVIFPGWMLHRTGKNFNDDPRVTINTNIIASPIQITPNSPKPVIE